MAGHHRVPEAAVPSHPSCFFIKRVRLFLVVYVDDLLLSGPADEHEGFWHALRAQVDIEPPEELDRYLGRHHKIEDCSRLPLNLIEAFRSPVEA